MLAYAGRGLPSDQGSHAGSQIRDFVERAAKALVGLTESCTIAVTEQRLESPSRCEAFVSVLHRDAQITLSAIELVLSQPYFSSHWSIIRNDTLDQRAFLTDLFLIEEFLRTRR